MKQIFFFKSFLYIVLQASKLMNREGLVDKVWHILITKQNLQNLELLKVWSCWQRHKVNYWIYATSESDKQYISDLDKW